MEETRRISRIDLLFAISSLRLDLLYFSFEIFGPYHVPGDPLPANTFKGYKRMSLALSLSINSSVQVNAVCGP